MAKSRVYQVKQQMQPLKATAVSGGPTWEHNRVIKSTTGLTRKTVAQIQAALGFPVSSGGIELKYFDVSGGDTDFSRFRMDCSKKKGAKYLQAQGSGIHIYFPLYRRWKEHFNDKEQTTVITEGEVKAAYATAKGQPCIGLGGVSCWRGTPQGLAIHPDLAKAFGKGSKVAVIFDSDAETKPQVASEEALLAGALVDLGCVVKVVRLPELPGGGVNKLDDFLIAQGSAALTELTRLIDDTEEWAPSRTLHELNANYVFDRSSGLVYALPQQSGQPCVSYSVHTFCDIEAPKKWVFTNSEGRTRIVSAAKAWIEWSSRRQVSGTEFAPGEQLFTREGKLNTWRGFGVEPSESSQSVDLFLKLVEMLVPAPENREWFLSWLAYPLQNPGKKLATAVVLHSHAQGVGKSLAAKTMTAVYGQWNCKAISSRALQDNFNEFATESLLAIGEEATPSHDIPRSRALMDHLKNLVTENYVRINRKHIEAQTSRTFTNYLFLTNNADSFHIGEHDRRMAVFTTSQAPAKQEFYEEYAKWLDVSGPNSLMHFFLHRDLSNFNPHERAPWTEAKDDMAANSRSQLETWVHELKADPGNITIDLAAEHKRVHSLHTLEELMSMFGNDKFTTKAMTQALLAAGFRRTNSKQTRIKIGGAEKKVRLWIMRDVEKLSAMRETEIAKLYYAERGTGKPSRLPTTRRHARPENALKIVRGGER